MSWVFRRPFDYRTKLGRDLFAILYAAGAAVGAADVTITPSGTLGGAGELAGTCAIGFTNSAIPTSTNPNALGGTVALDFGSGASRLTGVGALLGVAALDMGATVIPSGTNAYQPHMWAKKRRPFDPPHFDYHGWTNIRWTIFPYSVSTATAGIGSIAISVNGVLTGAGTLSSSQQLSIIPTGTLSAAGGLAGNISAFLIEVSGTLIDVSGGATLNIAGNAGFSFATSGDVAGTGALYGPAAMAFSNTATMVVVVPPSGSAGIAFSVTGRLVNAAAGAGTVTAMSFSSTDPLAMYFTDT